MIQLSGTKYALGPRTAWTMWVGAIFLIVSYLLLSLGVIIGLARRMHVYRYSTEWLELVSPIAAILMVTGVFLCGLLVMTFMNADSQRENTVDERATALQKVLYILPLKELRTHYVWPFAAIFAALLVTEAVGFERASGIPATITICTALAFMLIHAVRLIRLARHMSHEAYIKVNGEYDECRDFDWKTYGGGEDDDEVFRRKFKDRRWKLPSRMTEPSEAERYASKARSNRMATMAFNAFASLFIVAFVHQPIISFVRNLVQLTAPQPQPSILEMLAFQGLVLTLLIPVGIQIQIGNLEALTKVYEDTAKDLREKKQNPVQPDDPQPETTTNGEVNNKRLRLMWASPTRWLRSTNGPKGRRGEPSPVIANLPAGSGPSR